MTVKELKNFLEKCDDDMLVTVTCCDDDCLWTIPADCEIREINGEKTVYIGDWQEFI